jgi:rhamnose transport system permease protein
MRAAALPPGAPSPASAGDPHPGPLPLMQERGLHLGTWFLRHREAALLIVLALLVAGTALVNPRFVSAQNLRDVGMNVAIIALLATGLTLVMLMRHIDLSVSSTVGFTAFLVGELFTRFPAMPVAAALLAGLAIGAAGGAINGALVTWGRVPSLVATLATLYIFRGLDYAWVQGRQINATALPPEFSVLGSGSWLGVPVLVWLAGALLAVVSFYLRHFRGGREFYALGSNPEAARLAGIAVTRRVFSGFVACGAIAGLAGVLWLARFGTVNANSASGIELQVVAAAVLGSVSIAGGAGTVLGATLGALLLGVIASALVILRVSSFWQLAIQGALIVLAIALDTWLARSLARRNAGRREHDQP